MGGERIRGEWGGNIGKAGLKVESKGMKMWSRFKENPEREMIGIKCLRAK